MGFLNTLFSKFDALCDLHSVYKVETAGDCYIVAGALMKADEDGATSFDWDARPEDGAKRVLEFSKVIQASPMLIHLSILSRQRLDSVSQPCTHPFTLPPLPPPTHRTSWLPPAWWSCPTIVSQPASGLAFTLVRS
jgi:hypothetical protein